MQELRESQAELTKKHNHLTEALTTVVGMIGRLEAAQERTEANIAELAEAQTHLSAKHAENDDRLNSLITVVERYISENRNGHRISAKKTRPTRRSKPTKTPRKRR
jgi:peptidoglycan hydrolase CwlO-like protein